MSEVQNRVVEQDEAEIRLDRWFRRHYPQVTHGHLERLLRSGQVRVDGGRAKSNQRLNPGQTIRVPPIRVDAEKAAQPPRPKIDPKKAEALRRAVLYRDDDVIVIDKPAGLAVQGGSSLTTHLDAMLDALKFDSDERPRLVHRLDKDTSGCLALARNAFAAAKLAETFRGRDARKYYWAVTVGTPKLHQGKIDLSLQKERDGVREQVAAGDDGHRAITYYSVVEAAGKRAAWVALWPWTGRTHQLRVHCAEGLGRPIFGDGKYGGANAFFTGADLPKQLHLHARRLILPHPRGGKPIDVTAPPPPHMKATFAYFGFDAADDGDPFAELD